jgi:hypothetical protein
MLSSAGWLRTGDDVGGPDIIASELVRVTQHHPTYAQIRRFCSDLSPPRVASDRER